MPPYVSLPAQPVTIAMYLTHVSDIAQSYWVVKAANAAIRAYHDAAGLEDLPTDAVLCVNVRRAAKRKHGVTVTNKKAPITLEVVIKLCEMLLAGAHSPIQLTTACLCAVLFAGGLRHSDLRWVTWRCIHIEADYMTIFLAKRKNDVFRLGHTCYLVRGITAACPVHLMERLRLYSGMMSGDVPVFRNWVMGPTGWIPEPGFLLYHVAHQRCLHAIAEVIGLPVLSVRKQFGMKSFRVGCASTVLEAGIERRLLQGHVGWRSESSMQGYVQPSVQSILAVTKALCY